MSTDHRPDEDLRYPPQDLGSYALLADGERGALVGPRGEICWLCAPRWHDEAVFAALIGGGGLYAVTPAEAFVPGGAYEDGSLIWRSRWVTRSGIIECRDALALPGETGRLVLLRRIVAREGPARVRVVLHPVAAYGREQMREVRRGPAGEWQARLGGLALRWSGAEDARPAGGDGDRFALELDLAAGQQRDLVLELSREPLRTPAVEPERAWAATERAWASAVPALTDTVAVRDARQSYALLRGMTSADGGMVAAATTSLPERAEEGRNYDYRYVWIRDQAYAGQAVAASAPGPLLDDAVRFTTARLHTDGPGLSPAYTVTGHPVPDQHPLDLPGYPGGYDRIGNHVNRQFQLDCFGEALLLFAAAAEHGRLDDDGWAAARIAADTVRRRWREADAGIWELGNRDWTHSRLICAAGLRRIAGAAPRGPSARDWSALANAILTDTEKRALHPDGHWQRSPDDPSLDAALLLPPLRGLLPADDPRTRATLSACTAHLTDGFFAYRFRHDDRPLSKAEGAFLLCGFVIALGEHQQGNELDAYRWFERNRDACGAPGLYAEEYDVAQRRLLGNLPQAFVHALLLEASARLARPEATTPAGPRAPKTAP
ncbi:glycoside hydrolase family 15 protein [Streptomyces platensis]|uniref:Glycoside hydrolase family 15 protein n=1 Tax=Streptomyces platensis TaxID=58346 RepID=A0AAE6NCV6_STRPT|nr:glycoside hydrolase family 15 protein [Streptomyces platensis]OSY41699.1 Trehalase [Streptomyces platensis]QEV50519.1 glycoside hydrolase family 15 protein [Streptomyces platensis]